MEIPHGNYVVIGDLHGRVDKLEKVARFYGDRTDGYLVTGDMVDGHDTASTIHRAIDIGARCVASNHPEHLLAAMAHPNEEMRHIIATNTWPRVHDRVLSSYGIYPDLATPRNAEKLRDEMEARGHFSYLWDAPGYIEGEDFVVLHADVTGQPWDEQKSDLVNYIQTRMWNYEQSQMPYQLGEGVKNVEENNLVASGLKKILVSGHFHRHTRSAEVRTFSNGQHLLTATCMDDDFVVAYETWTRELRVLEVAS